MTDTNKNIDIKIYAEDYGISKVDKLVKNLSFNLLGLKERQKDFQTAMLRFKGDQYSNLKADILETNFELKKLTTNKKVEDMITKGLISTQKAHAQSMKRVNKQYEFFSDTLAKSNKLGVANLFKDLNKDSKSFVDTLEKSTGPLLSMLFFGMALKQTFTGALKTMFEGYKKAIPEANKFNVLTNKLSANWEYFKFQLADTLANSPLFQKFIEFLVGVLNALQKLSPEAKLFIGVSMAILAAFGFILFVVGQILLGVIGIKFGLKNLSVGKFLGDWQGIKKLVIETWDTIKNFKFGDIFKPIKDFFKGIISGDINLKTIFNSFVTYIKNFFSKIFGNEGGIIKGFKELFKNTDTSILKAFSNAWKGIKSLFKMSPLGWIVEILFALFETIQEQGEYTFNSTWKSVAAFVVNLVVNLIGGIIEGFAWLLGQLIDTVAWLIEKAANMFGFDLDIPDISSYLSNLVSGFEDKVNGWVNDALGDIKEPSELNLNGIDRSAIEDSVSSYQNNTNNINNIYVTTLEEAVQMGEINEEQRSVLASLGVTLI